MNRGEIFVLLGHNGAGKTTTLSMLTGLIPPSSGSARMEGYEMPQEIDQIRQHIGVCPQHDVLWDDLTAVEHLKLYSYLKGVESHKVEEGVTSLLERVGLEQFTWDQVTKGYSGGMKRKLSLAIALIGDSNIVFLDEPTSGMDPVSRRFMYSFLDEEKKNKTIILTTHNMEEADILGDKIAILARGELRCCGSSMYLKNTFGVGYYLNVIKTNKLDSRGVLQLIRRHIPTAENKSDNATEITVLLPLKDIKQYPALFEELEAIQANGAIANFAVSMTTLEDVFLKIASAGEEREEKEDLVDPHEVFPNAKQTQDDEDEESPLKHTENQMPSPAMVFLRQMLALLWKKMLFISRERRYYILMIILPIFFVITNLMSMSVANSFINSQDLTSPIAIPSVLANGTSMIPFAADETLPTSLSDSFKSLLGDNSSMWQQSPSFDQMESTILNDYNTTTVNGGYHFKGFSGFGGEDSASANWTVLYNTTQMYSLPSYMSFANSAVLRTLTGDSSIAFQHHLHPLPGNDVLSFGSTVSISIMIGLTIFLSGYAKTIVVEKEKMTRWQLQLVNTSNVAYWLSHFIVDTLCVLLSSVPCWLVLLAYGDETYLGKSFLAVALLTIFFAITVIIMQYAAASFFSKSDNILVWMSIINFGTTIMPYILSIVLETIQVKIDDANTSKLISDITPYISSISPTSSYLGGLQAIEKLGALSSQVGIPLSYKQIFAWDNNVTKSFVFFSVQFVILIVILLASEIYNTKIRSNKISPKNNQEMQDREQEYQEDPDVHQERLHIESKAANDRGHGPDGIEMVQVYKSYGDDSPIVSNVSFGVRRGECFGLLGPNGAGKTSSIGVMTAQTGPSLGELYLEGNQTSSARQQDIYSKVKMGVCLQIDSLFDTLSPREHLRFLCNLRPDFMSLNKNTIDAMINSILTDLKLIHLADRQARALSGGSKRKLCVAIAMLLDNRLIYLDEPSTGMDPDARRALWQVILTSLKNKERLVVLTTHSMEEAEAVCGRIGIIVGGRIRCLGTTQELKARHGFGYRLLLKQEHGDHHDANDAINGFLRTIFPNATLLEALDNERTYELGEVPSLSRAFSEMERNKASLGITEYSITQNSLEQVFMHFCKMQSE
eukprot:TRINITY_DN1556_c0_g1_i4.p1 TRINITY_DN1556_c0_g1~~TRINITY_DN1556_c0_g1_i4.p1  ORF type:complete len:1123 (-),score=390.98 TRINITY_DN1556_c0_g1_i4:78-3446(-)